MTAFIFFVWLALLANFLVAPAWPSPEVVTETTEIRPLPGGLDDVPVFNSNSPEVVQTEGILLSTFPQEGMKVKECHLNYPFTGRFDLFLHHINNSFKNGHTRTLYLGVIVHNPGDKPVRMRILEAASYLSQPDSPFVPLPALLSNPLGRVYAGPGDRVMDDFLRGKSQHRFPSVLVIPAHDSRMLMSLPIPDDKPKPHINGRTTMIKALTDTPVYLASLGMFALRDASGKERSPELWEWEKLLRDGELCGPRDVAATAPDAKGKFAYGRVAGVDRGSTWTSFIPSADKQEWLSVKRGTSISYPISSVKGGTFGTGQIQSAPMLVRYPDTAYAHHGNYGVHYLINMRLLNDSDRDEEVTITFATPIKSDKKSENLEFFESPENKVFFRGSVEVFYRTRILNRHGREIHLVEDRGQKPAPVASFDLGSGRSALARFELFYPPDATPPQVLTIKGQ